MAANEVAEEALDTRLKIRAERMELLFQQSFRAAYMGMVMSMLLAAILWTQTNQVLLLAWVLLIFVAGVARLALYLQYSRAAPELKQVPRWEAAYLSSLILYFLVWGVGGVLILPEDSPVYVVVVCYFLIGMAGSAISVFSANRTALVSAVVLILAPVMIWLFWQREPLALGMAVGGTAFLLSAIYASRVLSQSLQQNLQMKHDLLMAKNESDELTSQLSEALDAANDASTAKTRFLASASHDLRQPIHSLSLLSSALGLRPLDDKSREISNGINQSIETLSHQLDALLDISKLDAGVVPVEKRDMDLYVLLDNLRNEMAGQAMRRGIQIELDCSQPRLVHSDPTLLERIARNLVTNAIRHNEDCTVILSAWSTPSACKLVVADTGKGIAEEEQRKIFEEFYQVDNPARDQRQGLGLGLAIIHRLERLLGLDMQFSSTVGRGTRFEFTLPAAGGELDAEPASGPVFTTPMGIKVLAIDDEPAVRSSMGHLLDALDCDARLGSSTAEALELTADWVPDLVLVDYRLGGEDSGLQAISALRERMPGLPAYLVTGDVNAAQFEAADRSGVEILNKPLALDDLQGLLASVSRR